MNIPVLAFIGVICLAEFMGLLLGSWLRSIDADEDEQAYNDLIQLYKSRWEKAENENKRTAGKVGF
jgi:hypothetical protein